MGAIASAPIGTTPTQAPPGGCGCGSSGTPTSPVQQVPPSVTTSTYAPTATVPGFQVTGDANEQAQLGAALSRIGSTSVGAGLLGMVQNRGVHLDIVSDEEYVQRTGEQVGTPGEAVAVFISGASTEPSVLIRASKLTTSGSDTSIDYVLAHELTHAAQYVTGEEQAQYVGAAGGATNGLTADQLKVGTTLMRESGAELVASAIGAQQVDPAAFNERARTNFDAAAKGMWNTVNTGGYNPNGYQVPTVVSPTAVALVKGAIGA